jgi:hypothetical protein
MPIQLVTNDAPGVLPVDIAFALQHMRAPDDDTALVQLYLQAAVNLIEDYTGRALIRKTYCLNLDSWPNYRSFWPTFRSYVPSEIHPLWTNDNLRSIELRRTPLIAINTVKYYDPATLSLLTMDASNYAADTVSVPGRIVFVENGYTLPDLVKRPDAVQINFDAGYSTKGSGVDASLQVAVLMLATVFYNDRSAVTDINAKEMPLHLRHILRAMRVESMMQEK